MLSKYVEDPRTIKAVTDFRLIKQHITNARRIDALARFSSRLQKFAEVHDTPLEHLEIAEAGIRADAKTIIRKVDALEGLLTDLNVEMFYGEEKLWQSISRLLGILEKKLQEANKRR
jgi:hypothetical protein